MTEIAQPSDKIKLTFILFQQRTCMIKARPKYPMELFGNIYIDNIQKAVVICLMIPTIFPFDTASRVDNVRHTSGYFYNAGSSIKRKYCWNDQTNNNSFVNIIDVNITIQDRRVLWSGFYHTGSLLKQHRNEIYFVRWLNNFRHHKVFYNKYPDV